MLIIRLFAFFYLISIVHVFAEQDGLSLSQQKQIYKLMTKDHCFALYKEKYFEVINKRKFENTSAKMFFTRTKKTCPSYYFDREEKEGFVEQIDDKYKLGHQIIFKKNKKFYVIKEGIGKQLSIDEIENIIAYEKKKRDFQLKEEALLLVSKCSTCQISLSSSLLTIENESSQTSFQLGWRPFLKTSEDLGWVGQFSVGTFLAEDNKSKTVTSYSLKSQILIRKYFKSYFTEFGGGQFYIFDPGDSSLMFTAGGGYILKSRQWIFTQKISLVGFYFHFSNISSNSNLNEYNLGLLINL